VAETTVKRFLCCGFRRTGKAMEQVYRCWLRICREINVFPRLEYRTFYICGLFTESPSYDTEMLTAAKENCQAFGWLRTEFKNTSCVGRF
jgi:hypothetical protein